MKKTLKTLAFVLALALVISGVPMETFELTANAETSGYYTYTVTDGEVTITACDTSAAGHIVIPDTIDGYPVTAIGSQAFNRCGSITGITLPDSLTSFASGAIYQCNKFASITVSDNNAKYSSQNGLLYNKAKTELICCPGGRSGSVSIPAGVTTISDNAFYDCYGLTSITIPDSVTSIGVYAFWNCRGLTGITIPDSVTSIGDFAFSACKGLKTISFGNGIKKISSNMFEYCVALTKVTLPDSVTTISSAAFYYCTALSSVTIHDSVTSIANNAFNDCSVLTDVYFIGTEAEWNAIGYDNATRLPNTTIHFVPCYYGHSFTNYVSNNDATCAYDGTKTAYCDNGCGATDTQTDTGTIKPHVFTDYISNNNATCMSDGTKTAYCDNGCGARDTLTDTGTMSGHSFTDYVSNNDALCTTDGTKTAYCDYGCGNTDTVADEGSAGHKYIDGVCQNCDKVVSNLDIIVGNKNAISGSTVTVTASLENNPGFAYLALTPIYDSSVMTIESVASGLSALTFTSGSQYIWQAADNYSGDTILITVTLKIDENAANGVYSFGFTADGCYDIDDNEIAVEVANGSVAIADYIYGDANGDGNVNGKDVIRLRHFIAGGDVEVSRGADANGDGKVNGKDLLRLRKYMASLDPTIGTSDIVLGPLGQE